MRFKSDEQRKAVMASLHGSIGLRNITNKQFLHGDFDGDGVKNKDDCKPFDKDKHKEKTYGEMSLKELQEEKKMLEEQYKNEESFTYYDKKMLELVDDIEKRKAYMKEIKIKIKNQYRNEILGTVKRINETKKNIISIKKQKQNQENFKENLKLRIEILENLIKKGEKNEN